jgi:hypothetical protein
VSKLVGGRLSLVLEEDLGAVEAAALRIQQLLPGIEVDKCAPCCPALRPPCTHRPLSYARGGCGDPWQGCEGGTRTQAAVACQLDCGGAAGALSARLGQADKHIDGQAGRQTARQTDCKPCTHVSGAR